MVMVMALGCTLYVIQRDDADEVYKVIIYDIVLYFIIFKPAYLLGDDDVTVTE